MKIIIVHTNERTVELSKKIAEKQADTYLVSERPFRKSIRVSFEMSIREKWQWLVIMGGDQFLENDAIKKLDKEISKTDKNVFRVSGYGYDHLMMRNRMMAPSVYRVSLLKEALRINAKEQIRPEAFILHTMEEKGYPFIAIKDILATHDSKQFYKDIYRKGLFAASKSMKFLNKEKVITDLKKSEDIDHKVFLLGISDFIKKVQRTPREALDLLNLTEKEPLS